MPDWKTEIRQRLAGLQLAPTRENTIVEELSHHLDEIYAELLTDGMTTKEAERQARAELHGSELLARELRRIERQTNPEPLVLGTTGRSNMTADLWQDLRYGIHTLLKQPSFTLTVLLTLALGIGANTAIFSVIQAVLLRPLPYRNPADLVLVQHLDKASGTQFESVSYPDWQDWCAQNRVFEDVAIFREDSFALAVGADLEQIQAATVSANFFPLLGVNALRGRTFRPEEEKPGSEQVAVLSYATWQRLFSGNENAIGQSIQLSDENYTVIGVLPSDFKFPLELEKTEVWTTPARLPEQMMGRGARNFEALARLKPGVALAVAQTEMAEIAGRLAQQYQNTNRDLSVVLVGMHEVLTKNIRRTLWLLFGVVLFVLLIACANVANLLLVRALSRQKELAVRAALGASAWRITRQLLTESLLLALAGGALGLLFAAWGIQALLALSPANLPRLNAVELNASVLGFTLTVALLTGVLFGLVPAWRVRKPDLNEMLKEGGKRLAGARRNWLQAALVVSEVALALMLLIGAGLLINSFIRLQRVELGFNPENVLTASISLPDKNYPTGHERIAFVQRLQERLQGLPGVRAVSLGSSLPFTIGRIGSSFEINGRRPTTNARPAMASLYFVMPDYFATTGMRLLQGRSFTADDNQSNAGAVIVNETFARQFFPHESPLGQRISKFANRVKGAPEELAIVGIVGDVRGAALDKDPTPVIFVPYLQAPQRFGQLAIRTEHDALALAHTVRQQIRTLDATQTVPRINTIENLIADTIKPQRFNLLLLGVFAAIGLALTLVGIYGVMSYLVTGNLREIGIRMALGAQTSDVLKLVLGHGARLALLGIGLGLAGAFGLTRVMKTLLFGVSTTDPLTFAGVAALLCLAALLACWIPARRAARVDPVSTLRRE